MRRNGQAWSKASICTVFWRMENIWMVPCVLSQASQRDQYRACASTIRLPGSAFGTTGSGTAGPGVAVRCGLKAGMQAARKIADASRIRPRFMVPSVCPHDSMGAVLLLAVHLLPLARLEMFGGAEPDVLHEQGRE